MTSSSEIILEGTVDYEYTGIVDQPRKENIASLSTKEQTALASAQFVLPFTKEIFANVKEQEKLFKESIAAIQKELPQSERNNLTIVKTIIEKKDGKRLRAVRVMAPPQMAQSIQKLKMNGIDVRGRHINAWGPRLKYTEAFPREANLYFQTLPHFFKDEEVFQAIKLPTRKQTTAIKKATIQTEDGFIYSGNAICKLMIENEQQLQELTKWAEKSCASEFSLYDLKFYCNIPSLLECENCRANGKNFRGHHRSYCQASSTKQQIQQIETVSTLQNQNSTQATANPKENEAIQEIEDQCTSDETNAAGKTSEEKVMTEQREDQTISNEQTDNHADYEEDEGEVGDGEIEKRRDSTNQPNVRNLRSRRHNQKEQHGKVITTPSNQRQASTERDGD